MNVTWTQLGVLAIFAYIGIALWMHLNERNKIRPEDRPSGKVLWRSPTRVEENGAVYTDQIFDRLQGDDRERYNSLRQKHFGDRYGTYWPRASGMGEATAVEAFLRDWFGSSELQLAKVVEYERTFDGYFVWLIQYKTASA